MAREAGVKVEGAARLRRTMRRAGADLEDLKAVNAAVAALVAGRAATRAPVRSGALAASVRGNRAAATASVRAGRAAVPYAGPIHWGWPLRGIAADPFIAATAQDTEPVWVAMYRDGVEQAIAKVEGA